jgi:hypothetical protein
MVRSELRSGSSVTVRYLAAAGYWWQLDPAAVTTEEKTQGFCGAAPPWSDFGRPFGNAKDALDQNQRGPAAEQTLTGWLSVTTVATSDTTPAAQLGLQSSSL